MGEIKTDAPKDKPPPSPERGSGPPAPDVSKEKPGGDGKPQGDGKQKGDSRPQGDGAPKGDNRPQGDGKPKGDAQRPEGRESDKNKGPKEQPKEGRKPEYDVSKKDAPTKDAPKQPSDFKAPPGRGEKTPGKDAPPTKDQPKEAPRPKELSKEAQEIIRKAKDQSKPIDQRAKEAVREILNKYYPDAKVKDIEYNEKTKGLEAQQGNKDGKIFVGKNFVDNIDRFNNRINQVGHETKHVEQYRQGMNNPSQRAEREYKAHEWQSQAPDREGGPSTSHTDRANHANEALKEYGRMPKEDQKRYERQAEELRKFEAQERRAGGNQPPP
jgi:hypothetical protein